MSLDQRQAALQAARQAAYEDWMAKIQAAREATEQVTAAMRRYNECLRAVDAPIAEPPAYRKGQK